VITASDVRGMVRCCGGGAVGGGHGKLRF
jgi:hypothetical protein